MSGTTCFSVGLEAGVIEATVLGQRRWVDEVDERVEAVAHTAVEVVPSLSVAVARGLGDACEQGSIGCLGRWPGDLSTKNGDLVAENDDLDGQIGCVPSLQPQQLEHPDEQEVEEGQGHRPPSLFVRSPCNCPAQRLRMTFSAPTGLIHEYERAA